MFSTTSFPVSQSLPLPCLPLRVPDTVGDRDDSQADCAALAHPPFHAAPASLRRLWHRWLPEWLVDRKWVDADFREESDATRTLINEAIQVGWLVGGRVF